MNVWKNSEIGKIKAGVARERVSDPILFTLFTADIPAKANVFFATYGDDTIILATSKSTALAAYKYKHSLM